MKLSTVALITMIMISIGYVWRIVMSFKFLIDHPVNFLSSSIGTWALMFFFFMLWKHSRGE